MDSWIVEILCPSINYYCYLLPEEFSLISYLFSVNLALLSLCFLRTFSVHVCLFILPLELVLLTSWFILKVVLYLFFGPLNFLFVMGLYVCITSCIHRHYLMAPFNEFLWPIKILIIRHNILIQKIMKHNILTAYKDANKIVWEAMCIKLTKLR